MRPAIRSVRLRRLLETAAALLMLAFPSTAEAQRSASYTRTEATPTAGTAPRRAEGYPHFRMGREVALTGSGAALLLIGYFLPADVRPVPAQGLDASGVGWSIDRGVIGAPVVGAASASDWTRNAAMAVPLVLALVGSDEGSRWRGFSRRAALYTESLFLSQGATFFGKAVFDRARPYAYLPEVDRPADAHFDVTRDRTFRAMPSGHASSSWNGSAIAMTEHLLTRPEAGWVERGVVGFISGALAGATSALRVEGDQHFPSDVVIGAALGIASGVAVPLVHRGSEPMPPAGSWWEMAGGAALGTLVGVLVAGAG